jgi:uncharacterized phiE125 gp8 family phage protein
MRQYIAAQRTAEPAATPISVDDLKTHLRIEGLTSANEDTMLASYIAGAVGLIERHCGIALVTQTWTAKLDFGLDGNYLSSTWGDNPFRLYDEIELPSPPLQSVTSIKYIDQAGVEQTLDTSFYQVDTFSKPGRILRAYNMSWPTIRPQRQAVTIVFVTGFGAANAVPEPIKHAIKLICGAWWANREQIVLGTIVNEIPWGARELIAQYKIHTFG